MLSLFLLLHAPWAVKIGRALTFFRCYYSQHDLICCVTSRWPHDVSSRHRLTRKSCRVTPRPRGAASYVRCTLTLSAALTVFHRYTSTGCPTKGTRCPVPACLHLSYLSRLPHLSTMFLRPVSRLVVPHLSTVFPRSVSHLVVPHLSKMSPRSVSW